MRIFDFDSAIVRPPARSVVGGLSAAGLRPDYEGVVREHEAYVRALKDADVAVELLPRLHDFPDSVFVEDTALVFHGAAIVLRPGAPSRAGEAAEMAPVLEQRFERVLHLTDGFADGGDVLVAPHSVFIGLSARTNADGAKGLVALLRDIGLNGQAVATSRNVLHLKSDCALLDEETVLVTARLAASRVFKSFRQLIVPEGEEGAANALRINDRVFLSLGYPETADMLARANYRIVPLATREIAKIDAGLSCMSLRWKS
jgi:dimethylargininase